MSRHGITADEYQDLIDTDDISPLMRSEFERLKRKRIERDEFLARLSEKRRREMVIEAWQRDTLRELRKLFAELFEINAWMKRDQAPSLTVDRRSRLYTRLRGMNQRYAKARREAAEGCAMQVAWLADHAELIAAVAELEQATEPQR